MSIACPDCDRDIRAHAKWCARYDEEPVTPGQNGPLSGRGGIGESAHTHRPPNARHKPFVPFDAPYVNCPDCADYIRRRIDAVAPAVVLTALARDLDPYDLMHRYRISVHNHHLAGNSLETP